MNGDRQGGNDACLPRLTSCSKSGATAGSALGDGVGWEAASPHPPRQKFTATPTTSTGTSLHAPSTLRTHKRLTPIVRRMPCMIQLPTLEEMLGQGSDSEISDDGPESQYDASFHVRLPDSPAMSDGVARRAPWAAVSAATAPRIDCQQQLPQLADKCQRCMEGDQVVALLQTCDQFPLRSPTAGTRGVRRHKLRAVKFFTALL